jgi:hypothetical protein
MRQAAGRVAGSAILLVTMGAALRAHASERAIASPRPKRVLALFDFGKDSPANVIWDRTIRATLTSAGSDVAEYDAEYLDAARFNDEGQVDTFHDYLARKYAHHPVDVIIAMDLTTRFLLEQGRDLFVGVPIVHTVAVGSHPAADSTDPRLVGIRGVFDARSTLQTALGFHPETKEVVVVCGAARGRDFLSSEVRRQLGIFEGRVKLTYLSDLSLDELRSRMARLHRFAIVLFVVFYDPQAADRPGRYSRDIAAAVARASGRPVYGLFSSYLYDGVVGGHMYSLEDASAWAAQAAASASRSSPSSACCSSSGGSGGARCSPSRARTPSWNSGSRSASARSASCVRTTFASPRSNTSARRCARRTGARTNFSPRWRTSCGTRSPRSARPWS